MKKTTKISVVSGIAAAAAAAIAAIGIGVGAAAQPANVSQNDSPGTEAVSGVSTSAPPAHASSSPLPTKPVTAPSGSIEYAASWRLEGTSGNTLYISITGPGSGCTTLGYVQVSETTTTVTVTPQVIFDQRPGEGCTADLKTETGNITLAAPLGDRTLIHGATTAPGTTAP
jgi:hypothetical protein